jgi:hypothetical protein
VGTLFLTKLVLIVATAAPPLPVPVPGGVVPPVQVPKPPAVEPPVIVPAPPIDVPSLPVDPPAAPSDPPAPTATPVAAAAPTPVATPAPAQAPAAVTTDPPRERARPGGRRSRPRRNAEPRRATTSPARIRTVAAAAPAHASPVRHDAGPARAEEPRGLAGDLVELVAALPAALLWSLGGIAALALGLAANAYWQSRQRAALKAQREGLLDDIGLLSGALLPPVPEFDDLTVSAAYRPADGPAAGGDFYDVFALDDRRVGVLLGDVSGHGRASVRHAALARFTLRTLLAAGHAPGEALARADCLLERDLRPDFVTVIAAVYDRPTASLTYAKAGHAPPIVLGAAHDPDAETPAPPLGLATGASWPEYRLRLADGVSVCLVTDGLEDARRGGCRLGRDSVVELAAAHERPDAARLLGDVGALADCLADDTAAVVLSRA